MRQPSFQGVCKSSADTLRLNAHYSRYELGVPEARATAKHLAIVGGGPSTLAHLDELRAFDGEIWGINGAARWCNERGVNAALFTASPCQDYPAEYRTGITRAILSYECHPWLFDALRGPTLTGFDRDDHGPTSVCAALPLAMKLGFETVSLFGCEGSHGSTTHLYQNTPSPADMMIRIGGADFVTNVGYFVQTQLLSQLCREAPGFCKERSGGMLTALTADPDGWDVIKTPSELKAA